MESYATIQEADTYFQTRLHESAWSLARPQDRFPALVAATRLIDSLAFKGEKHSVYELLASNPSALPAELREANASQELEFPRGSDTVVPKQIKWACYEIAHALLDGVDPALELENMSMNDHGIASVRASFNRLQGPIEHFMNMIPSPVAWNYLRPFLRDDAQVRLVRVS